MTTRAVAPGNATRSAWANAIGAIGIPLVAAGAEYADGRRLWGSSGQPGLWSGNVLSPHNSQFVADPYTFTHVTHGILWYGLFRLLFPRLRVRTRFLLTVAAESAWEVIENTDFVIQRYRAATISLHYYGDSIVNSMFDIAACMAGFWIAALLPPRFAVAAVLLLELALAIWIRDGLLLNIVMLLHPIGAIRTWQAGVS